MVQVGAKAFLKRPKSVIPTIRIHAMTMNVDTPNTPKEPTTQCSSRPRRSSDVAESLDFLDRLKELVFEHLTRIESLARIAGIELQNAPSDVEAALRERILMLEAAQARLLATSARRDLEWREFLEDLEQDRNRLARAWQEIEQERLRAPTQGSADSVARGATATIAEAKPIRNDSAPQPHSNDLISLEILRQFRALQGDVRRNSKP